MSYANRMIISLSVFLFAILAVAGEQHFISVAERGRLVVNEHIDTEVMNEVKNICGPESLDKDEATTEILPLSDKQADLVRSAIRVPLYSIDYTMDSVKKLSIQSVQVLGNCVANSNAAPICQCSVQVVFSDGAQTDILPVTEMANPRIVKPKFVRINDLPQEVRAKAMKSSRKQYAQVWANNDDKTKPTVVQITSGPINDSMSLLEFSASYLPGRKPKGLDIGKYSSKLDARIIGVLDGDGDGNPKIHVFTPSYGHSATAESVILEWNGSEFQ